VVVGRSSRIDCAPWSIMLEQEKAEEATIIVRR
jgi:hypothetical protein